MASSSPVRIPAQRYSGSGYLSASCFFSDPSPTMTVCIFCDVCCCWRMSFMVWRARSRFFSLAMRPTMMITQSLLLTPQDLRRLSERLCGVNRVMFMPLPMV